MELRPEDFEKAKKLGLGISYAKAFLSVLFDFVIGLLAIAQVGNDFFSGVVLLVLLARIIGFTKKDFKGDLERKAMMEQMKLFQNLGQTVEVEEK